MREGGVQLDDVGGPLGDPRTLGSSGGRGRPGQVAGAERVWLDPVIDSPDPGGPLAHATCDVVGREHHGGRTVGDRRTVVPSKRRHEEWLGEELLDLELSGKLSERVVQRVAAASRGHLRHVALRVRGRLEKRSRLQGRQTHGIGPEGRHVVGIELETHDLREIPHRRLPEPVDERGVHLAGLDLHPCLVERPRGIHLHVGFPNGRPRGDRVEGDDEREGLAGEIVAAARAGESDLPSGEPGTLDRLCDDGNEDLHLVSGLLAPQARGLREGNDGDVPHQT